MLRVPGRETAKQIARLIKEKISLQEMLRQMDKSATIKGVIDISIMRNSKKRIDLEEKIAEIEDKIDMLNDVCLF